MPDDGASEGVLLSAALVPDALELVEVVLDQVIKRGGLGISRPVGSLRVAFHMESNCPRGLCANSMFRGEPRLANADQMLRQARASRPVIDASRLRSKSKPQNLDFHLKEPVSRQKQIRGVDLLQCGECCPGAQQVGADFNGLRQFRFRLCRIAETQVPEADHVMRVG